MENLLNDRQHLRSGTEKAREKDRVTGNGSRERDKYRARESGETGEAARAWLKWITYCCPSLQHVVHLAVPAFQVNRITANLNEVTPPSLPLACANLRS